MAVKYSTAGTESLHGMKEHARDDGCVKGYIQNVGEGP